MDNLVRIKSNRYGLEVHLNSDVPFPVLLKGLASKFQDSARFFGNTKMAVTFLDRALSNEEEQKILDVIEAATEIEIVCIIDTDVNRELTYRSIVENTLTDMRKREGQFYKGTLKKRQVLESETSLVILGDVESGAKVIAKGNVVIVGTLSGSVHAGAAGDMEAYVVALSMQPKSLRIGTMEARRQSVCQESLQIKGPKIAVVDGHRIYVDPLLEEA